MISADTALDQGLALDVLLRDGRIAQVRLVTESDREQLAALNAGVTLRTRYLRYFSVSGQPGSWYIDKVLQSAQAGSALVAVLSGRIIALASFARMEHDPTVADLALLVDDEHQVNGLGALLLEHLAALARHRGVQAFTADVLAENTRMLRLLGTSGFTLTSLSRDVVAQLRVDLAEIPAVWEAVERRERAAERSSLDPLLRPRSIAVVGSSRASSVASQVHTSLQRSGFRGRLDRVDASTRLDELPAGPDLVVVAVPADRVLGVAEDAAACGARGLLVISAGFAESGPSGRARQAELLRVCRAAGMRLIGPNCLGVVNTDPAVSLNATFCDARPRTGAAALVSQSGAVGIAALRHAEVRGTGLSLFVSTGNKADVSGNDLLAYLADDPRTRVIALYLESFGNARRFLRLARSVGRTTPVVVVKAGRSAAGAKAGRSHTAAAATPELAIEALLTAAGVLRADDLDELFDLVAVLEPGRLPRGPRVAIVGNSGGPGVLAVDACEGAGLLIADLTVSTTGQLSALLPPGASVHNPVDLLATVTPEVFAQAVQLVMSDPGVDAVVAIYTPLVRNAEIAYATELSRVQRANDDVPLLAVLPGVATPPPALDNDGRSVPFFEFPERAVRALGRVAAYATSRGSTDDSPGARTPVGALEAARQILTRRDGATGWLSPAEGVALLQAYGVPCAQVVEVRSPEQARSAADLLGYPVALKAWGPTVVHKSDVGGVALGLHGPDEVAAAYGRLQAVVGSAMTGAVVQRMHATLGAFELIVGLTVDDSVGPLVLVGAGGSLTDLLADRVVRVPPTTHRGAVEVLSALRCAPLFTGFRDLPPLDVDATVQVILALGALARDLPEIRELDVNPLLVDAGGAIGLDVRIRVGPGLDGAEHAARNLSLPPSEAVATG